MPVVANGGGDYAAMYKPKPSSTLDEAIAEADARGMSYGQLQTERRLAVERAVPAEVLELEAGTVIGEIGIAEPIDMLKAIETLVSCSITQNSRITAVSAVDGQFSEVAFVCCGSAYVLSLRREDQE